MSRIKLKFYCVQPISIRRDHLKRIFLSRTQIEKIQAYAADKAFMPTWMQRINRLSSLYDSFSIIPTDSVEYGVLKAQLKDQFLVDGKLSLAPHLIPSEVSCCLIYDFRLMYFNLVYELSFEFKREDFIAFVRVDTDAGPKKDLYNTVRNLLVKEDDNDAVADWTAMIRTSVKEKVSYIFNTLYQCKCDPAAIRILNNTGNITNVVALEDLTDEEYKDLSGQLVSLNNAAERLGNYSEPLYLENDQIYHFNGRFHTIILRDSNECDRYIPIQFHVQFMWFYLNRMNEMMEKLNNEIIGDDTLKNVEFQNRLIDVLIHKVEILTLHNAKFKTAIEIDNEKVYRPIRQKWNLDQLLTTSNRYIAFFKDYLHRIYVRKTSKIEQRQNVILAFISILQLIALISVWNDYIALLNEENIGSANALLFLFNRFEYLRYFNLLSPVLIMMIIVAILLYFRKR